VVHDVVTDRPSPLVIDWRMKDRGMRRTRAMAGAAAALRVAHINEDWDEAMAVLPEAA
jgi:hypothetical protein